MPSFSAWRRVTSRPVWTSLDIISSCALQVIKCCIIGVWCLFISPLVEVWSIMVSVCTSVYLPAYHKIHVTVRISVHVTCGRGSFLLWWQCNTEARFFSGCYNFVSWKEHFFRRLLYLPTVDFVDKNSLEKVGYTLLAIAQVDVVKILRMFLFCVYKFLQHRFPRISKYDFAKSCFATEL